METNEKIKDAPGKPLPARIVIILLKISLPIIVLAGSVGAYQVMLKTAPIAERQVRQRQARLVEVVAAKSFKDSVRIQARGVVRPALEVSLSAQVSGKVVSVSPELLPGGRFQKGDEVLRLDTREYEYRVQQHQGDVTRAQGALTLEKGNQDVARREFETLEQEFSDADMVLVLREPQLETAKGELARAEAVLDDAKLNLARTTVVAPFDALVARENIDVGSQLSNQTTIANLVGTDTYWVELSVPQADLKWIEMPTSHSAGAKVQLRHTKVWGESVTREGTVIRLLPALSVQGRMARILVAVADPLSLEPENADQPRMLIGQYLEAEIEGKRVQDTVEIAREHVRDGNKVWVMNPEKQFEIRELSVLYRGDNSVLTTSGIAPGEQIITTSLSTYVEGMALRTGSDSTEKKPKQQEKS